MTFSRHYLYTSVQCVISRIFQHGQIIPDYFAFQVCSLHWEQVEKWLIQFWNRLLVRIKCTMCDFPNFSTRSNNYRFSSITPLYFTGICNKGLHFHNFLRCYSVFHGSVTRTVREPELFSGELSRTFGSGSVQNVGRTFAHYISNLQGVWGSFESS